MNCDFNRERLIDFLDGNLSLGEEKEITSHIKECQECKMELEELRDTVKFIKAKSDEIKVPKNIVKGIREDNIKKGLSRAKKPFGASLVAIVVLTLFVVTAFAADQFGVLEWWKKNSLEESKTIGELINKGYGDKINISVTDNNIKITLESVVADDINTILMLSIEDLKENRKLIPRYEGINAKGDFVLKEYEVSPVNGDKNLYTEEPNISRILINLKPLNKQSGNINLSLNDLIINGSRFKDKGNVVNGNWNFDISVTKHDSIVYNLDKITKVNNRDVYLDQLVIAPTKTLLKYHYSSVLTKDLSNFSIIANDREYNSKRFGFSGSSSHSSTGENEGTVEFDSMYFDDIDKLEIRINSYTKDVLKFAKFKLDLDKDFPQEFEYMGSKIVIEDIKIGDEITKVIMTEALEDRKYERLNFEFEDKDGNRSPFGDTYDGYVIDDNGVKININEYWFNDKELEKPRIYPTKHNIDLNNIRIKGGIRKKGGFIPAVLEIKGYDKTVYINNSIKIKLKEDMIVK